MMSDIPRAGTEGWYHYYAQKIDELGDEMDLPNNEIENAKELWEESIGTSRAPLPLAVDCLYICAKLSGNRVSIKATKRITKRLWGKAVEVLPLDRRRNTRRWVWDYKAFILSLYPDEDAWEDFTEAWQDKVVDVTYFEEE